MTREKAIKILRMNEQAKWRSGISVEEEKEVVDMAIDALTESESLAKSLIEAGELLRKKRPHGEWRPKPLPRATHCIVAIKWAEDDIEVTEADTTFLLKEHSERIVAWMPLPDPPKGGGDE